MEEELTKMVRRSLHPVHTLKHIIDKQGGLVAGTKTTEVLVNAKDSPIINTNPGDVEHGSTVNAIFLNVQVAATGTAALANVYMYVVKNPGNQLSLVDPNVVGTSDIRKFIIHQEMIMTEKNTTAIPRTLFKGVISIPKHMRRMGIADRLQVVLLSPGVNYDYCLQSIYKEVQ